PGLLELRIALSLEEQYLPSHPRVKAHSDKIRITEEYLLSKKQQRNPQLQQARDRELGPALIAAAKQKLKQAIQVEQSLEVTFQDAKNKALSQNGSMAKLEVVTLDIKRLRSSHDVVLEKMKDINMSTDKGDIRATVV